MIDIFFFFSEIVEPLLNLYCFIDEQLYVNESVVYKITLKNPGTKILHLTATLNQSNSFMFSGHKQVSERMGFNNNIKNINIT